MRISVNKNDKGFREDVFMYEAFLNGNLVKDCITADEERGVVICYARNTKGEFIVDRLNGEPFIKRVCYGGRVKIHKRSEK